MSKEENVTSLFALMHKLRNTKRKGWHDKNIKRSRVESVADHIYGCQMLAYAMQSEFDYDIDIEKVILMLTIHEIGETIIGDLTIEDMSEQQKSKIERKTVKELLDLIPNSDLLKNLFEEFELKETKEAKFAYQIDKAECDLQARLYEQDGSFDEKYQRYSFTKEWVEFDRGRIAFDNNFDKLLEYIIDNDMVIKEHSNNKIQNVISFYTSTNSLKNIQRTGEIIWKINPDHYGSIAEHIYSTQMLAIAIYLIYETKIDIKKVINMLSIHELGEIVIGDKSALLKNNSDRDDEWNGALIIAGLLSNSINVLSKLSEFNENKTVEANYSKYCDKLAPDMISKIYDQLNLIDLNNQDGNPLLNNPIVKRHLEAGKSFSEMWILYGQEAYKYPEPFISISNHALNNDIDELYTKKLKLKTSNKNKSI